MAGTSKAGVLAQVLGLNRFIMAESREQAEGNEAGETPRNRRQTFAMGAAFAGARPQQLCSASVGHRLDATCRGMLLKL